MREAWYSEFRSYMASNDVLYLVESVKGVETAEATRASAPAMLKPRGGGECIVPTRNNMPSWSAGYTQFCIAGLQRSPEEHRMHKNSALLGLRPADLTSGAYSASQAPTWWVGAYPQEPDRSSALWFRARLAPAFDFVPKPMESVRTCVNVLLSHPRCAIFSTYFIEVLHTIFTDSVSLVLSPSLGHASCFNMQVTVIL